MGDLVPNKENQMALPEGMHLSVDATDIIIPRAKLFQGQTSEREKYPDAKDGQVINTATQEVLPTLFVPVLMIKEWIRFNARNPKDRGYDAKFELSQIIWRSTNPIDPRVMTEGKFTKDKDGQNHPPLAPAFIHVLAYFPTTKDKAVISFGKTSYNAGRFMVNYLMGKNEPIYFTQFNLGSKMTKSSGYSYYIFTVKPAGPSSEDDRMACKTIAAQIPPTQISPDFEEETAAKKETQDVWQD